MDARAAWSAADTDRAVLWWWKEALARRDGDTATAALLDCLHDHDQDVRIVAVEALAGRSDPSAGAALMNCPGACSDKVRQATVMAGQAQRSPT